MAKNESPKVKFGAILRVLRSLRKIFSQFFNLVNCTDIIFSFIFGMW